MRAHSAVAHDAFIYLIGGGDGPHYFHSVWRLDTQTLRWSKPALRGGQGGEKAPVPPRRRAHAAVSHPTRGIVVFGGGNGTHALDDVWALDVSRHSSVKWTELKISGKRRPTARGYHTLSVVAKGDKAIVLGGSDGQECFADVFVLDLVELTWTEVKLEAPGVSFPRLSHSACVLGSYILVFGGHDGQEYKNDVLFFDLGASLPSRRVVARGADEGL